MGGLGCLMPFALCSGVNFIMDVISKLGRLYKWQGFEGIARTPLHYGFVYGTHGTMAHPGLRYLILDTHGYPWVQGI